MFSLKDSLQIFQQLGIDGDEIIASGGGASSPTWLQIQANILEKDVCVCDVKEQASWCLLAGVGMGMFSTVEEACRAHVRFQTKRYTPNHCNFDKYREHFEVYQQLYRNNQNLML